jgi:hypothetical protein
MASSIRKLRYIDLPSIALVVVALGAPLLALLV